MLGTGGNARHARRQPSLKAAFTRGGPDQGRPLRRGISTGCWVGAPPTLRRDRGKPLHPLGQVGPLHNSTGGHPGCLSSGWPVCPEPSPPRHCAGRGGEWVAVRGGGDRDAFALPARGMCRHRAGGGAAGRRRQARRQQNDREPRQKPCRAVMTSSASCRREAVVRGRGESQDLDHMSPYELSHILGIPSTRHIVKVKGRPMIGSQTNRHTTLTASVQARAQDGQRFTLIQCLFGYMRLDYMAGSYNRASSAEGDSCFPESCSTISVYCTVLGWARPTLFLPLTDAGADQRLTTI